MNLTAAQQSALADIAQEIVDGLGRIASAAERSLRERGVEGAGVGLAVRERLTRIQREVADALDRARREPFVARVRVQWDDGEEEGPQETIFISRGAASATGLAHAIDGKLASYRGPLGRVVEFRGGEYFTVRIPRGQREGRVLERAVFRPERRGAVDSWDACDDQLDLDRLRLQVASLRAVLRELVPDEPEVDEDGLDFLEEVLQEAAREDNVWEGRRRRVVERMSLRDQAVLDQYQGEVFRLPIDRRLLLLGPPGTGKTTTLIKRIAQKRTLSELPHDERDLLEALRFDGRISWRMYSPTVLLNLYLRDAFNKEGVPAGPAELETWDRMRRDLGRDVFRILKSADRGRFRTTSEVQTLRDASSAATAALHDSFQNFLDASVVEHVARTLDELASLEGATASSSRPMIARLAAGEVDRERVLRLASTEHNLLSQQSSYFERQAKQAEQRALRGRYTKVEMTSMIETLAGILAAPSASDQDGEEEDEDDDEASASAAGEAEHRRAAVALLKRALRHRAREHATGVRRSTPKRIAAAIELLAPRMPEEEELRALGELYVLAAGFGRLHNAARRYVTGIPQSYAKFRRAACKEGRWFAAPSPDSRDYLSRNLVRPEEVDVMLLAALANLRQHRARVPRDRDFMGDVDRFIVSQTYVDEVTDFSAVQLACMIELSDRRLQSFFACGDFRQRITRSGIASKTELHWITDRTGVTDFDVRTIDRHYRQSPRLVQLAGALAMLQGQLEAGTVDRDEDDADEVAPLLLENADADAVARWLAERILEVERLVGKLPSIAVFVDGEARIAPLVERVTPFLEDRSIGIVGCPEGRVVGHPGDTRVFDVRHIKGLEFEAVFFVGVDALATRMPDLFDRFLYVGVTRAATYLGITCEGSLPPRLESLRDQFSNGGW